MISLLIILGGIAAFIGFVWLVITAFAENVLWGAGIVFIPILSLVYAFLNWEETKVPASIMLGGAAAHVLGRVLS